MTMPHTDEQVGAILEAMRAAAPQLTETAIQYVQVQAIVGVAGGVLEAIIASLLFCWLLKRQGDDDWSDAYLVRTVGMVGFGILFIIAIFVALSSLPAALAPAGATLFRLLP